jgi:protein SCO1
VNARLRLSLMTTAVVLLGVIVVLVVSRPEGSDARDPDGIQSAGSPYEGASRRGVPSPDFDLKDQDGKRVTLASLRGRPAIVTFMYATCEDTCPATAAQISSALDDLGGDRVPAVIISVDPKNDTPQNAQQFLNKMRLGGRAEYVLGTREQLEPIWRAYGIQEQGKGFEHTATVLVLDAQGRQQVSWPVDQMTDKKLAHDVRVVQEQGAGPAR